MGRGVAGSWGKYCGQRGRKGLQHQAQDDKGVCDRGCQGFAFGVYTLLNVANCSSLVIVHVSFGGGRAGSYTEARQAQGWGVCAG